MSFDESDVWTFDEEIDPHLLVEVLKLIKDRGFQFGWHSNKGFEFSHWNINFGGSKKARLDVYEQLPEPVQALWSQVERLTPSLHGGRVIRSYVNAQTFGTEGYPHTDTQDEADLSIVVYLNPEWPGEWAGETVFFSEDDDVVKAVLPRFGRVSIFPGAMRHAARGVSRVCPECRYVLVYKVAF